MKPFKTIQSLDRVINNLKFKFKYSKDKKGSENIIKELTNAKNEFNDVFNSILSADVLETLILEVILLKIRLEYKSDDTSIYDLNFYLKDIGKTIKEGMALKESELISHLKSPYDKMMVKDFDEKQDLNRVKKMISKVPTNDYFRNLIQESINILKTDICLTKN